MKKSLFDIAARENTGKSILDSGDYYGRHWQRPALQPGRPLVTWDRHGATIDTALLLAEYLQPDSKLQRDFERFANKAENERESWFAVLEKYREHKKLVLCARDNTYNGEQDLSQVFIWETWAPESRRDWICSHEDQITVIQIHTGCDVRGGYSKPVFCRALGEYQIPVDLVCGYTIVDGRTEAGLELPWQQSDSLCERWMIGYSSYPAGELENCIDRIFEFTRTADTVCALLKTGELVKIRAYSAAEYAS